LGHGGVYKRRLNNECLLCSLYNNTFSSVKEHFETLLEYHSVSKTIKLMTPSIGSTVLIHILFLVNFDKNNS